MDVDNHIKNIQEGYTEVIYRDKKYGMTRSYFNEGKSIKVYAKELGGNHFISFNYYYTAKAKLLKPCEMPEQDVIDFLENYKLIT